MIGHVHVLDFTAGFVFGFFGPAVTVWALRSVKMWRVHRELRRLFRGTP